MVKLAVLMDALNRESGALDDDGTVVEAGRAPARHPQAARPHAICCAMPELARRAERTATTPARRPADSVPAAEHDSCRVGSLAVSRAGRRATPSGRRPACRTTAATIAAAASASRASRRPPVRAKTCLILNTIGPDRAETHAARCSGTSAAAGSSTRQGREMRARRRAPRGCDEFRAAGARASTPARTAGAAPGCARTRATSSSSSSSSSPRCSSATAARCSPARTGCSGARSTATCDAESLLGRARGAAAGARWRPRAAPGATLRAPRGLRRRRARGVLLRARAPARLALLPHARRARRARRQVCGQARAATWSRSARTWAPSRSRAGRTRSPSTSTSIASGRGYPGAARARRRRGDARRGAPSRTTALHAHVWGMHHRYPDELAGHRRRRPRQSGGRASVQGLQRAAHAQRRAGGRRLDRAVPAPSSAPCTPMRRWARAPASTRATRCTSARRSPTPSTPPTWWTSRAACSGSTTEEATQIISPITGLDLEAMDPERRARCTLLVHQLRAAHAHRAVQVHHRGDAPHGRAAASSASARTWTSSSCARTRSSSSVDTAAGGVNAVANGSEAKIADSMLRVLHQQGVLGDAAADLRFNMRPGGNPGRARVRRRVRGVLTPRDPGARPAQPLRRGGRRWTAPAPRWICAACRGRGARGDAAWRTRGGDALWPASAAEVAASRAVPAGARRFSARGPICPRRPPS